MLAEWIIAFAGLAATVGAWGLFLTRHGRRRRAAAFAAAATTMPAQAAPSSAAKGRHSAAAGACGCKDRCRCGDRSPDARGDSKQLLPGVIESMRRLSPTPRKSASASNPSHGG